MNRYGCCVVCGAEVFESLEQVPSGPFSGLMLKSGAPVQTARRVTTVMVDGTRMDLTLCAECELTPDNLVLAWRKVRQAWALEGRNEFRELYSREWQHDFISPMTLREQWVMGAWQLQQAENAILGVLYEQPWIEVAP